MFMEERHHQIIELLKQHGKITVTEIAESCGISVESARRDLTQLERQGLCKRTHGGAILPQQVSVRPPLDRDFATMPVYDNYREIARAAAGMIRKDDCIYLTGGSFGHIMTSCLPTDIPFTLVVNSVDIAKALRPFSNIEVYLAGGRMRQSGSLVDSLATEFVSRMHFDLCFITGGGLTASFGLSNGTDETAAFQRTVIRNSRRKCLLMPGSKIGADSFIKVCDAAAFDTLITDWDCIEEHYTALKELGITVTTVEMPQ